MQQNPQQPLSILAMGRCGLLALLLSALSLMSLASSAIATEAHQVNSQLLDEIALATDEINLTLPQMVDDGLRLERTSVEDSLLVYYYTLIEQEADITDRAQFAKVMNPIIHGAVCQSEELAFIINVGIPVVYAYSGKFGQNIASFIVDKQSCLRFYNS
jgi:hypothetical protein